MSEALDARRYLTTPSADLAMVGMFAGVDIEVLVDRMRIQMAKAQRVGSDGESLAFMQTGL